MRIYVPERGLFGFNISLVNELPNEYRIIPPRIKIQPKIKIFKLNQTTTPIRTI
jgi:hypothetical protein